MLLIILVGHASNPQDVTIISPTLLNGTFSLGSVNPVRLYAYVP